MKHFLLALLLTGLSQYSTAQQCGNCQSQPSVALYDFDVRVAPPQSAKDSSKDWLQWRQLFWFARHIQGGLYKSNGACVRFNMPASATDDDIIKVGLTSANVPPAGKDLSRFADYILTGTISENNGNYLLQAELQTSCSRKTVFSTSMPIPLTASSEETMNAAQKIVGQLSPLAEKIRQFELRQREENEQVAFASLGTDEVSIKPKKRVLAAGEETEIEIVVRDCDGVPLKQREIRFKEGSINGMTIPGTTGGTVTPSTIVTDANGKAKAKFKMGSQPNAVINAHLLHEKPIGCAWAKLGSMPIGSIPYKIEISYMQMETQRVGVATLPGVYIEGGDETDQTIMMHSSLIYHYPSAGQKTDRVKIEVTEDGKSKNIHVSELGYYDFSKTIRSKKTWVETNKVKLIQEEEKGSTFRAEGIAGNRNHSEFFWTKASNFEPEQLYWSVEYPASNDMIATGTMSVAKGDPGVSWQVKKITDPTSMYKTEYLVEFREDAVEAQKKGNQAMKDLFGFDMQDMARMLDPTKPPEDAIVRVFGYKYIRVRILSPYAE